MTDSIDAELDKKVEEFLEWLDFSPHQDEDTRHERNKAALTRLLVDAQKKPIYNFPRAMGKTAYFTEIFLKECKAKNTAEFHHPDYVVMSRAQYDKLQIQLTNMESKE